MSDDRRIVYKPWADNIDDPTNEVRVPFTGAPQSICGLTLGSEHRVGILDWSDTKATIIDQTLLTPAILAALGFTYTRTGGVFGRVSPGGPGNYVRHATNDPEFDFTEVDGKNYPSLIVRGAATPLISYSADLTNAAWTKTNCTAALVTGSLESAAAPNGHSLVTATANNATVTRQLTRASANRNARWKIKAPETNVGDVLVSHGKSASTAYSDVFDIDTSGEWLRGTASVDGVISVSSGKLTYTAGANDAGGARIVRAIAVTPGALYRAIGNGVVSDTTGASTFITTSSSGTASTSALTPLSTNIDALFVPMVSVVYAVLYCGHSPSEGDVTTINDIFVGEVEETTLTPGTFHDFELGEYTGANPFLAIRLTDNGDTVEHYDVQMAELAAGTPVPNFVPQGATPAATGAALLERTLLAPPDEVDVSVLFQAPATLTGERYLFEVSKDASNRASVAFLADDVRFQNRVTANELVSVGSVSASDVAMVDAQISASLSRSRLDLGDWESTATARIPSDISRLTIGSYLSGLFPFGGGIVSVRDNNGQLLGTAGAGFNISAIERYEASL